MLVLLFFLQEKKNRGILSVKSAMYLTLTGYVEALWKKPLTSTVKQVRDTLQIMIFIMWQVTFYH